jgi:hypothetical protein
MKGPRRLFFWGLGAAVVLGLLMMEYPLSYNTDGVDTRLLAIDIDNSDMRFGVSKDRSTVEIVVSDNDKVFIVYVLSTGALVSEADIKNGVRWTPKFGPEAKL